MKSKRLMFAKAKKKRALPATFGVNSSDLLRRAKELTGIANEAELVETALNALIQREAASYLQSLGGSMPNAEAAPRRRLD